VPVYDPQSLQLDDHLVRDHTRASLMSDTKWQKLVQALDPSRKELERCIVKFVGSPEEHMIHLPVSMEFVGRPWLDTAFGPVAARQIEWLLIPPVVEYRSGGGTVVTRRILQDLDRVEACIKALGRYPIERTERGLLVTGHLPA
jgi:hypothetical protein